MAEGRLILVVGPSGAGKDSLLDAARSGLAGDERYCFPVRDITRPADAGGEQHQAVTPAEFASRRAQGAYALSWEANGHGYGIPASIGAALAAGQTVICNISRAAVPEARRMFAHLLVIVVTASIPVLAKRIAARGRESAAEIEARLARAAQPLPDGDDVMVIDNDGPLDSAVAAFLTAIIDCPGAARRSVCG